MSRPRRTLRLHVVPALLVVAISGATLSLAAGVYASYAEVSAVLAAVAEILPPELRGQDAARLDAAWNSWARRHDQEIRSRLDRGDEDTLVNWMLRGTSFTSRRPVVPDPSSADAALLAPLVAARAADLVAALQSPGTDERRLFARRLLEQQGYGLQTAGDRERLTQHLLAEAARVADEQAGYARDLAGARRLGDVTEEFAARSRLFRTRGLSLDTSFLPGFAIERSLGELRSRGLVAPAGIRDVAIIGPGLDFSDKSSGYDFYPQQTLQPFALIDSLIRTGLADRAGPARVTTLDLSPRVNDHLAAARRRALRGLPYVIRLPLDVSVSWKPEVVAYWNAAGDRIGTLVNTSKPSVLGQDVRVRAVRVPPRVARQVEAEDLDIVVQRLADRRFDLIVATNVFVYYDLLDQVLALSNVEAMLRPGGFLLSNNALLELPASRLRSVGYLTVPYSDRPDDGDHIVWYRRLPD